MSGLLKVRANLRLTIMLLTVTPLFPGMLEECLRHTYRLRNVMQAEIKVLDRGEKSFLVDGRRQGGLLATTVMQSDTTTGKVLSPNLRQAPKILLYSHDTFGLGNIRRTLLLATQLREEFADAAILIVTGSPVIHAFRIPASVDYI